MSDESGLNDPPSGDIKCQDKMLKLSEVPPEKLPSLEFLVDALYDANYPTRSVILEGIRELEGADIPEFRLVLIRAYAMDKLLEVPLEFTTHRERVKTGGLEVYFDPISGIYKATVECGNSFYQTEFEINEKEYE